MRLKQNLTDLILMALEKTVDGYIRIEDFTYNPHKYIEGYPRILNKSMVSRAIKRLREKGLVDFLSDEYIILQLTDSGRERVIWSKIKSNPKQWDSIWRIVIFDIPEKRRRARDLLRSKLKQWGFVPWQKSVWVTKADCTIELRNFIKRSGIQEWVLVIETSNIGQEPKTLRS